MNLSKILMHGRKRVSLNNFGPNILQEGRIHALELNKVMNVLFLKEPTASTWGSKPKIIHWLLIAIELNCVRSLSQNGFLKTTSLHCNLPLLDTLLASLRDFSVKEVLSQTYKKLLTMRCFMFIKPLLAVKIGTPPIMAQTALPLKTKWQENGLLWMIVPDQKWLTMVMLLWNAMEKELERSKSGMAGESQ